MSDQTSELERLRAENAAFRADVVDALSSVGVTIESTVNTSGVLAMKAAHELIRLRFQLGELKAAFRANMLRATWPEGFDVNAEIDRVLAEIAK